MDRQTKRWIGYGVGAVIASVVLATFGIVWPAVIFTVLALICSIQIRRSAAHRRPSTSKLWNSDVGPFTPLRGHYRPFVWVLGTTAVAAYFLLFAFRERSIPGTVFTSVVFVAVVLAIRPDSFSRGLDVAEPVPPDAPVNESGSAPWPQAVALGLSLLSLVLLGVVLDWDVTWVWAASSLADALNSAIRARSIARWEDEHGVEILRAAPRIGRRTRQYLTGSGSTHLYVRPRPEANGDGTDRTEP